MARPPIVLESWRRLIKTFYDQLGYDSARLADPVLVGPAAAPRLRVAIVMLASLAVASSITAVIVAPFSITHGIALLGVSLVSVALYHGLPQIWRGILASGVDQELPAVLVYLVPYSASPKYIADVIASLPPGVFKWFSHESARLRLLIDMGLDPITALRRLAETTPSRRLREVLLEYTSLQLLGAQSSEASIRILDRAISMVREKWHQYREAGRAIVELSTAGLVSLVALSPMIGPASGVVTIGVMVILVVASSYLLASRPKLGDYSLSATHALIPFTSSTAAAVLAVLGRTSLAVAVLLAAVIVGEIMHRWAHRRLVTAMRSLRSAAEKARLGLDYTRDLAGALPLGGPVRAVLEASRVAGSIGVGQALVRLVRVVEEAGEQRKRASLEAAVLEGVSAASPPVMALAAAKLSNILAAGGPLLGAQAISLTPIIALAPLAPLPASVLRRGRAATPLAGLVSMLATLYIAASLTVH